MKIIAHRGFSENYPENTLLAFKKAVELGVDGIETDLCLSRDEKAIIFHDDNLKRITGIEQATETLTLEQLQELDAGEGEHIPSLDELLQLIQAKVTLVLEIKYNPSTYKRLCEVINASIYDKLEWAEVSCFEDAVLEFMYQLNPKIKLHKLISKASVLRDTEFEKRYHYVSYLDIKTTLAKTALNMNLFTRHKVIFWTVSKEDIETEKKAGLYAIMTDNPTQFL